MHVAIVVGSHRPKSQSAKVGEFVAASLTREYPGVSADIIDLGKEPLPLWDEGVWNGEASWEMAWGRTARRLQSCDALVLVTPEWSGMVPPAVKNFLLLCGPNELADKPGLLVSVSSGMGGSYPISELRSSGYKNNFVCWIPDHVIVRNAEQVLEASDPVDTNDTRLRERLVKTLGSLTRYAAAFRSVRAENDSFRQQFQYGM